ncbi:hypothetical protein ACH4OX_32675 [Streptomyces roseolus]
MAWWALAREAEALQQQYVSDRWHPDDPELRFAESLARTHWTEA